MPTDYKELLTQMLAWVFLAGFLLLIGWGVRIAMAGSPDNELYSYFGTGFATLIASIVAAAFGQAIRTTPKTVLIFAYVIGYFGAGLLSIAVWIRYGNATPVLIRTVATGFFGLGLAIVGAYMKPHSIFG